MATGRFPLLVGLVLVGAWLPGLAGCTTAGPLTSRRNTMGMLKSSVTRLESSNADLQRQVASLKLDSSRAENELAQEKQANDELLARLDDAKQVIRRSGGDLTALNPTPKRTSTPSGGSDEIPEPARSAPVRRSSRSARKPPAASIPAPSFEPSASATISPGRGSSSADLDPGPQAYRDDPTDGRWLPIVRSVRGRPGAVVVR